jgi:hypothetical protein
MGNEAITVCIQMAKSHHLVAATANVFGLEVLAHLTPHLTTRHSLVFTTLFVGW